MKTLPLEMVNLTALKSLNLSRCYIQRTRDLSSLPSLISIRLDSNDFESTTLAPLPATLMRIDISSNHLQEFPEEAFQNLVNLVELKMNKNRLECLDGIACLQALETLSLDDNKLSRLPQELGNLRRLRTLTVRRNLISKTDPLQSDEQSIHPAAWVLTNLIAVDLEGNPLSLADVSAMDGVDVFLTRRKKAKDKSFAGGAMTDMSVFGLT